MRAEVDTSAVFARYPDASPTERFAAADRELRQMPAPKRADLHAGERCYPAERLAWRLRFADEFGMEAAAEQLPNSPREYVYKVLSRAVRTGLLVRLGMGRYRPTEKAKALRGVE